MKCCEVARTIFLDGSLLFHCFASPGKRLHLRFLSMVCTLVCNDFVSMLIKRFALTTVSQCICLCVLRAQLLCMFSPLGFPAFAQVSQTCVSVPSVVKRLPRIPRCGALSLSVFHRRRAPHCGAQSVCLLQPRAAWPPIVFASVPCAARVRVFSPELFDFSREVVLISFPCFVWFGCCCCCCCCCCFAMPISLLIRFFCYRVCFGISASCAGCLSGVFFAHSACFRAVLDVRGSGKVRCLVLYLCVCVGV